MATAAINCKDLPINPRRLHYSVENKRMRVFNARFDFVEIEIEERNGENVILAKDHNNLDTVRFVKERHLHIAVGKASIYLENETHRVSLSGINSARELENLAKMHQILREAGFIE